MTALPTIDTPGMIQLWEWIIKPLEYLHNYDRQCGDIFEIKMFGPLNEAVLISNPQSVQEVLTNDTKQFSTPGSSNQILKPFLGDRGIILLDGAEHRQRRQLLMPQFHGDKIRVYSDLICKVTQDLVSQWRVGETINLREQMQSILLSVILQAV